MEVVLSQALSAQPLEVVRPEVAVGDAIAQDVVRGPKDAVADRHGGLLLASAAAQPGVLGPQIGPPRAPGPPATLHQQKYLQLRSRFAWSLSNLVALLRMNLFVHRDLWTWLDRPFEGPPTVLTASQGVLDLG
jgi:hypothetical protein